MFEIIRYQLYQLSLISYSGDAFCNKVVANSRHSLMRMLSHSRVNRNLSTA